MLSQEQTSMLNLQLFTKYLIQTLVFMSNSALREKFILMIFTGTDKIFISGGGLNTRFWDYEY